MAARFGGPDGLAAVRSDRSRGDMTFVHDADDWDDMLLTIVRENDGDNCVVEKDYRVTHAL